MNVWLYLGILEITNALGGPSLRGSLDSLSFPVVSSLTALNDSGLNMRAVTVKEVMWCWSCNKVMEHDVSNHAGSAGGWVTIVCKGCRATQVEQLWKDGQIRDSLRGQI